jgi:RNA-directed DNA polymerase
VKVKSEKSPYDSDLVHWSTRMGRNPELPSRAAVFLNQQKGKCPHCGLTFRNDDVMEVDPIIPKALRGKDEYKNLQLLHRHCHDEKTTCDLIEIMKINTSKFLDQINKFISKFDWECFNISPYWGNC